MTALVLHQTDDEDPKIMLPLVPDVNESIIIMVTTITSQKCCIIH